ncbi:DUF4153 domain-containing protein [Actinoplanes sp. NPDC049265]|uniref:DUF4153 domain-containing protein n=1 Tax=Actinoplanes sp. NPDC049265 TaxID=3363902 RepID=UPI003714BACE
MSEGPKNAGTSTPPQPWNPPAGKAQPDRPAGVSKPATPVPPVIAMVSGPWQRSGMFGSAWPGPGRPVSPAAAGLLIVAALIAAVSVTGSGLGWLAAGLAGAGALAGIRRLPAPRGTVPWPDLAAYRRGGATDRAGYGWAAATVALLAVGTLRAAPWLFALAVLTAVGTGALAVAGGRSFRTMAMALMMFLAAPFRALPWVVRGLALIRRRAPGTPGIRVAATVVTSVFLLLLFGALLASADATFARLLESLVPEADGPSTVRGVFVFVLAGGVLGGAAFLRATPPAMSAVDGRPATKVNRWEWAVPLGLLALLFLAFVGVQLAVLFGGSKHVLDTDGLTYAEYARGGFWQLLIVTGLTLAVLGVAARWAPRDTPADRLLIRVIMGALAVLTLVIVASALHRMTVYADTYGLTRLRILVLACEAWLGVVFLLVLVAGVRLRAAWLPRVALAIGVLTLLGLAVANPDRMIAESGVARYERTGRIDSGYLSDLSPDAVPALTSLQPPQVRDCTLFYIQQELRADGTEWSGWSYGKAEARRLLATNPAGYPADCPGTRSYG